MKKLIFTIFIFLLPFYVFAYSKYIIPGGKSIGININSDGLVVVGYYKVDNDYINKNINIGDRIIKIDNKKVNSINDMINVLSDNKESFNVELIRNKKAVNEELILKEYNNSLKTGLYVKDNIVGIGTLTNIDPYTKVWGSLGHEIEFSGTNSRVEVRDGNIFDSMVTNIVKSRNGMVGTKKANIFFKSNIGTIIKNNNNGIYGFYNKKISNKNTLEIATFDEIKKGNAYILTVIDDKDIKKYNIEIVDKYNGKKNTSKAFGFKITDQELLSKTGGIIQGMSGSPIIQNNKIIGAVTNVVVDDVTLGYGISIITMLKEGDSLRN